MNKDDDNNSSEICCICKCKLTPTNIVNDIEIISVYQGERPDIFNYKCKISKKFCRQCDENRPYGNCDSKNCVNSYSIKCRTCYSHDTEKGIIYKNYQRICDICKKNIATKNICEPTVLISDMNGYAGYMWHYKIVNSYCYDCYKDKYK